ncbi:MarR family winged helix-turn-helix transcriptional regulator [Actinocatenispora rupis]|uniref:HTH marR-type domain-containing protein n=1 Tax=Actinocatenispora rupis TaxID=519421 RepID=A0A8J3JE82_9ACTN|nr:MarR family winged helix-turn-helix transcriptional regulator [Actinocatenispora rupis]GID13218.1 hypothetical protein Aru02nite_41070 [Actinocatenispora rupis]
MSKRSQAVETIQRELIEFARRARGVSARSHPGLSLVAYTLLTHVERHEQTRAADLAEHYVLDKSTVSRQLAELADRGLLERVADPRNHRSRVLRVTAKGRRHLDVAREQAVGAMADRLTDWPDADLARFASYLERYNSA